MGIKISIVSPVYKNAKGIEEFISSVKKHVLAITSDFEIILVNDDSPDNSWHIIKKIAKIDNRIKGISLSRNFGQHPAIFCGLSHSSGDVVVIMDCDLQEDPSYIPLLLKKYFEGFDIVYTYKKNRAHKLWKNVATYLFFRFYNYLIDNKNIASNYKVGTYSLISRKVANSFLTFKDCQFHYILILRWLGFNYTYVEIEHFERKYGKSSYSFHKLFEHALVAIVFHSDKLLRLNIYFGFSIAFISFVLGILIIFSYFLRGFAPGWASIIVLNLFSLGVILFSIGILGLYIGKMFEQTKQRPMFVINDKINF